MTSSTTPSSTMDAGYCHVCDGSCQHEVPIQITMGNSPNDMEIYWTPQYEKLSLDLSIHFPSIKTFAARRTAALLKFRLLRFSNPQTIPNFSFTSSQDNFSSSRTATAPIRSLQSPLPSNGPTNINSAQTHWVAKARHHACAAHQQNKKKCDPVKCSGCPDRLNTINPPLAPLSSATPQSMEGMSPIGSQPRRTHSAPVNQRNHNARVGEYSQAQNMAFGPFQPPPPMLPSQNTRTLNSPLSTNLYGSGYSNQPINSFPIGVEGGFDVQSSDNSRYNVEENSGHAALYRGNNVSRYTEPSNFTPNSALPGAANAWYYPPWPQQMPTLMQATPQTYPLPNQPFGYPDNFYDPNQNHNAREIEQEISPPVVDNEQAKRAILSSLRKPFKGLVVALLARTCRVKESRLKKYM